MNLKVAGTSTGITAVEADVKIPGLPIRVVMDAIDQGYKAKNEILLRMQNTIQDSRRAQGDKCPVVEQLEVPAHRRSSFVSRDFKNLRKLISGTGVKLVPVDARTFDMFAPNKVSLSAVFAEIKFERVKNHLESFRIDSI